MQLEFRKNNFNRNIKDIYIRNNGKRLEIFYSGNGDLYFDIFGERKKDNNGYNIATFNIDINDELYPFFETLYNDITQCHVYYEDEIVGDRLNQYLKDMNANEKLIHNGVIIFYSDSIYDEKANILKISKTSESILLEFIDNEDDPIFGFGIRVSNSGSKYEPFNICFMRLFNKLQELSTKLYQDFGLVKKRENNKNVIEDLN